MSATVTEMRLPNDLLTVRVDDASGSDIFRPDRHVLVGSLTGDEAWRRGLDVTLGAPRSRDFGLTVTAGLFDTRQPFLSGRGMVHGIGEFGNWQEDSIADLGLKLDLLGDRLHYEGGVSRSEYGSTLPSSFVQPKKDTVAKLRKYQDGSEWQKLTADLWKGEDGNASVYAIYGAVDPQYTSLMVSSNSPLIYDGETTELGSKLRIGKAAFFLTYRDIADDYTELRTTKAGLHWGAFGLDVTQGSSTAYAGSAGGWLSRNQYWSANLRVALDQLLASRLSPGGWAATLLPGLLTLQGQRGELRSSDLQDQPSDIQTRFGLGFDWIGDWYLTDAFLTRTITDRRAAGLEETSTDETTLDLTQDFFTDRWDFSFYVSLGGSQSRDGARDTSYAGGVALSLTPKDRPKLTIGLDFDRFESLLTDPAFVTRSEGISGSLALDLSTYLPVADKVRKPYLTLKAFSDWSLEGDTESGDKVTLAPALLMVFGMKF